jgi:hypothetical protein
MTKKKPAPPEPDNIITTDCDITILGNRKTILKISPHFLKRNEEFRDSKKEKVRKNLAQYLLDKKVIRDLVQQISEEGM